MAGTWRIGRVGVPAVAIAVYSGLGASSLARAADARWNAEAGESLFLPSSAADHAKYGVHVAGTWNLGGWDPFLSVDFAQSTMNPVNPGAPEESRSGSSPLLMRTLVRLPGHGGSSSGPSAGWSFFTGLSWLFLDSSTLSVDSIPHAATLAASWSRPLGTAFNWESYLGIASDPLGGFAYFAWPETELRWMPFTAAGLTLGGRMIYYHAPGGASGLMPSATLALAVRI